MRKIIITSIASGFTCRKFITRVNSLNSPMVTTRSQTSRVRGWRIEQRMHFPCVVLTALSTDLAMGRAIFQTDLPCVL